MGTTGYLGGGVTGGLGIEGTGSTAAMAACSTLLAGGASPEVRMGAYLGMSQNKGGSKTYYITIIYFLQFVLRHSHALNDIILEKPRPLQRELRIAMSLHEPQ